MPKPERPPITSMELIEEHAAKEHKCVANPSLFHAHVCVYVYARPVSSSPLPHCGCLTVWDKLFAGRPKVCGPVTAHRTKRTARWMLNWEIASSQSWYVKKRQPD